MSGMVQREFMHSSITNPGREFESVNSHYDEHASRLAKQVILISSKDFFPFSHLLFCIVFREPEGWKPNALSSRSIPGPWPRLEW